MASNTTLTEEEISQKWDEFKKKFNRNYEEKEDISRKQIFLENLKRIEEHNEKHRQGLVTFTMGINQFSDLTAEEKKKYTHGVRQPEAKN